MLDRFVLSMALAWKPTRGLSIFGHSWRHDKLVFVSFNIVAIVAGEMATSCA